MKLAFVIGTRPEILKVAPVIKEAIRRKIDYILIHTNQHYSYELDEVFFKDLELESAHYNLKVGSADHNIQIAKMLIELDPIFKNEKPDVVIVQGDTNSTLAGALAASKLGIKIAHVEAGLRSFDREMPEEINRIITDSISDYLFAVTQTQKNILLKEGIDIEKIDCIGNTIVDTLMDRFDIAKNNVEVLVGLDLMPEEYFLLTMHRPSNVDNSEKLKKLISNLDKISQYVGKPFLWPIHPRTKAKIERENIKIPSSIRLSDPLGYIDFLSLIINSFAIFTDSGGIQEESCILRKPCVTLRENTERPETVDVGANVLVGSSLEKMISALDFFKKSKLEWINPFGDGMSSKLIIDKIINEIY